MSRRPLEAALMVAVALLPALAPAAGEFDAYTLQLSRLRAEGTPRPDGSIPWNPDDAAFRQLAKRLGAAMTSANLATPETLGHSGFALTAELSAVQLPAASLPSAQPLAGPLLVPSLHFRKGLPASLEVGARLAWIERSLMGVGTLELKWALNEGFGYLPAIAVRGHVSKLLNTRDFDLLTAGVDLGVGWRFAIAGMVTLTPYVGWDLVFVGATSDTVDFKPERTLAAADAADALFSDYSVFAPVRAIDNAHSRFYGGFCFGAGVFQLCAEVSGALMDSPAVLAWNGTLGFDF